MPVPDHIHPVQDRMLQRVNKEALLGQRGLAIWMTGLSGRGKSTLTALEVDLPQPFGAVEEAGEQRHRQVASTKQRHCLAHDIQRLAGRVRGGAPSWQVPSDGGRRAWADIRLIFG